MVVTLKVEYADIFKDVIISIVHRSDLDIPYYSPTNKKANNSAHLKLHVVATCIYSIMGIVCANQTPGTPILCIHTEQYRKLYD